MCTKHHIYFSSIAVYYNPIRSVLCPFSDEEAEAPGLSSLLSSTHGLRGACLTYQHMALAPEQLETNILKQMKI